MPSKICLFIISFSNKCQSSWITVGSAGSTGASGIILVLFRYTSYDTAVHESTPLSIGLVVFSVAVLTHFAKRCFSILPICSFQALLLFLNHSISSWMFRASLMTALRCWFASLYMYRPLLRQRWPILVRCMFCTEMFISADYKRCYCWYQHDYVGWSLYFSYQIAIVRLCSGTCLAYFDVLNWHSGVRKLEYDDLRTRYAHSILGLEICTLLC